MGGLQKHVASEYSHPGVLLKEDLEELGLSAYRVSQETGISPVNLNKILKGKRAITADTGLRLAKFLGMSEIYFMNMQLRYDMEKAKGVNQAAYPGLSHGQENSDDQIEGKV